MTLRHHRILLVEDNEDDALILRELLTDIAGREVQVDWVTNFESACTSLRQNSYDVCLTDYRLDGYTGMELLQSLPEMASVPVILLSGVENHKIDVEATKAGVADYLVKGHINAPLLERSIRYAIQRKESELALLQAQRIAQATVDSLPDSIAVIDEQGTIVAVNASWRNFAEQNGLEDPVKCIGANYLHICESGSTPEGKEAAAGIRAVMGGQTSLFSMEYSCHSPSEERWYEFQATRFTGNRPIDVVIAHRNITLRKRAEEQLRASQDNLAKAQEIAHLGSWEWDLSADLPTDTPLIWSDEMFRIFGYQPRGVVFTREKLLQCIHPDDRVQHIEIVEKNIREGTPYSHDYRIVLPNGTVRTVRSTGEVVFNQNTARPLKLVGTVQDITEQKRVEESLRQSNELLRAVTEGTTDAIFAKNLEGRYVMLNTAAATYMGRNVEGSIGKRDIDLVPLEVAEGLLARDREVIENGTVRTHEAPGMGDNSNITFLVTKGPLRGPGGEITGVVGIARDISERKRAEELLRESQQRLTLATESARIGIWDWDVVADKLVWDEQMYALYGIQGKNFTGAYEAWRNGLHPADREQAEADIVAALEGKRDFHPQFRVVWPNGEIHSIEAHALVQRAEDGSPLRMIGVNWDITERKQYEEALRIGQERFENVSRATNDVIWDWDLVTNDVWWNESFERLLGYERNHVANDISFWKQKLHPEDAPRVFRSIESAIEEGFQAWMEEYRYLKADGSYADILDRGFIIHDEHHNPIRMVGSMQDITLRKRAEEALRVSEARSSAVIQYALDCIITIDHEGRVVEFNPAAEVTFGYTRAEALGQLLTDLIVPPAYREAHDQGILRYLKTGQGSNLNRRIEVPALRKDGTEITVELAATAIAHVEPPAFTAYLRDITERKAADDALLRMRDELEVRVQERTAELADTNAALQSQIKEREEAESAAQARARQQEAVAELGRRALLDGDLDSLLHDATVLITSTLDVEFSVVMELIAEGKKMRACAAVGWGTEFIGSTVPIQRTSQAHYSLRHKRPTVVTDLREERRFKPSPILVARGVVSGVTVIVGDVGHPFGTLGVWTCINRQFHSNDVNFLQAMANVIAASIERRKVEAEIRQLNTQLEFTNEQLRIDNVERQLALGALREVTAGLEQANVEAERAREEAERANRAKSEFLSRMSHELRTPLNSILGFGQILSMTCRSGDQQQQENIQQILKAGRHLLALINEVLDIARIEAGRLSLSLEPVATSALMREVLDLVRPLAAERHIDIRSLLDTENGERYVLADQQRLKQVVLNLLSNAVKYNHESGQVRVEARVVTSVVGSPSVSYSNIKCEGWLRLMIRDNGPGLTSEDVERLFVPFERLRAARSRIEGTGIGLSLCKQLVEAMNGQIGVESHPGEGSTFWLELPLVKEAPQLITVSQDTSSREDSATIGSSTGEAVGSSGSIEGHIQNQSPMVLYIEDNVANIQLIERVIGGFSPRIRLVTAMQGRLGVELVTQHQPDLVLLDVHLPDITGDQVLRQLKANPVTKGIPVIAFSADVTTRQQEVMATAGADYYLAKPLDVAQFLSILSEVFRAPSATGT